MSARTPGPIWEIGSYSGGLEILKEVGPMGRFLFDISERPGLGIDAARIRATMVAAPELLAALERLIRDARPSNWDDEEDLDHWKAWVAADSAIAKARGQ